MIVLLHGGHAATNLVWSAVDRQEWHYSSPALTALVLKLVWLLHLGRVDDGDCAGDANEKTCPCNTGDVVAHRQIRIDPSPRLRTASDSSMTVLLIVIVLHCCGS